MNGNMDIKKGIRKENEQRKEGTHKPEEVLPKLELSK